MIYYIAHWDWILKNSRAEIAKKVDFNITGISPIIDYKDELEDAFSSNINWEYKRQKLIHLMGIFRLRRLIKNFKEKDIIHIFTLKSLIIYLISCIFTNKKYTVIASVTGLGYLFANTKFANFLKFVLRYFISSKINSLVDVIIFQNKDNQTKFVKYTKFKNRVEIIEGSGLQTKLITKKESFNKKLKIIFVGRLLKEKGIFEYIDEVASLNGYGVRRRTSGTSFVGFWKNGSAIGDIYATEEKSLESESYVKYQRNGETVYGPYNMTSSDYERLNKIVSFLSDEYDIFEKGFDESELKIESYEKVLDEEIKKVNLDSTESGYQNNIAKDETIFSIQELLSELGFSPGKPDGINGSRTRAAIRPNSTQAC